MLLGDSMTVVAMARSIGQNLQGICEPLHRENVRAPKSAAENCNTAGYNNSGTAVATAGLSGAILIFCILLIFSLLPLG